ncbi:MAG: VWA domain-containing protein [Vicinamibacterales bacterium]
MLLSRPTWAFAGLAIAIASTLLSPVTIRAQQPTFRAGTELVSLFVTVTDQNQRLVPDLLVEDFEILDNGRPQEIVFFQSEVQPITVVVMLDSSASMTASLDLLKDAAEQFLIRLLPADSAKVGAFNDRIEITAEFSNDRDELIAAMRDQDFGNGTRLYDALSMSLDELQSIEGRRVVLIFSDGEDTASRARLGSVIERARDEEVMVYAIGLEMNYFDGVRQVRSRPDGGLRRIAEETGGGYFELEETADLAPTYTRVAQELHSQYVIGFAPETLDGRVHELEVEVKRGNMTARARRSYIADSERLGGAGR